jgi:hypothetical protein
MRPTVRRVLATGWDGVRRGRGRPDKAVETKNQIIASQRQAAIVAIAMVIS